MNYMSIRAKICIFVLSIIIPLIILQVISIESEKKRSVEYQLKRCEDYSKAVGSAFINYIDDLWDTEFAIGQVAASHASFSEEQMELYMEKVLSNQKAVKRYSIIDVNGNVIASTLKQQHDICLADRDYMTKIKNGEEKVISGIIEGRLCKDIIMPVARGVWKNGRLLYIVAAAVDVNKLGQYLPQYESNKTGVTGIVDSNGMLVYTNRKNNLSFAERKIDKDSLELKALNGEVVRSDKYIFKKNGKPYISASVPISQIGWACYDSVSIDEIKGDFKSYTNNAIIYFVILTTAYLVAVSLIIKQILIPIDNLKNASTAIFNGDFSVRTNINGNDYVAAAGMAFDKMAEHIQDMEASRRLFLQTSAHELKNPLTGIKGIISLMRMKIESGKPVQEVVGMLSILDREVERLSHLLNATLEAVRIESPALEIRTNFKKVNIVDVVTSALKPFQASGSGHNFTLHMAVSAPVFVSGDPERLEDVMRNLLSNAVKYSHNSADVDVSIDLEENNTIISVKDRGIGIPEDQIDKIFDSFYRASNLKGNDPGGMGLGLYICKDIIKRHNGDIWAENCSEGGSVFFIKLPLYM